MAGIRGWPGKSVLTNTTPEFAGAGLNVSCTSLPLQKPNPETETLSAMVFCWRKKESKLLLSRIRVERNFKHQGLTYLLGPSGVRRPVQLVEPGNELRRNVICRIVIDHTAVNSLHYRGWHFRVHCLAVVAKY